MASRVLRWKWHCCKWTASHWMEIIIVDGFLSPFSFSHKNIFHLFRSVAVALGRLVMTFFSFHFFTFVSVNFCFNLLLAMDVAFYKNDQTQRRWFSWWEREKRRCESRHPLQRSKWSGCWKEPQSMWITSKQTMMAQRTANCRMTTRFMPQKKINDMLNRNKRPNARNCDWLNELSESGRAAECDCESCPNDKDKIIYVYTNFRRLKTPVGRSVRLTLCQMPNLEIVSTTSINKIHRNAAEDVVDMFSPFTSQRKKYSEFRKTRKKHERSRRSREKQKSRNASKQISLFPLVVVIVMVDGMRLKSCDQKNIQNRIIRAN